MATIVALTQFGLRSGGPTAVEAWNENLSGGLLVILEWVIPETLKLSMKFYDVLVDSMTFCEGCFMEKKVYSIIFVFHGTLKDYVSKLCSFCLNLGKND